MYVYMISIIEYCLKSVAKILKITLLVVPLVAGLEPNLYACLRSSRSYGPMD